MLRCRGLGPLRPSLGLLEGMHGSGFPPASFLGGKVSPAEDFLEAVQLALSARQPFAELGKVRGLCGSAVLRRLKRGAERRKDRIGGPLACPWCERSRVMTRDGIVRLSGSGRNKVVGPRCRDDD